eukprot:3012577-Prymnesium_polylepis.1
MFELARTVIAFIVAGCAPCDRHSNRVASAATRTASWHSQRTTLPCQGIPAAPATRCARRCSLRRSGRAARH